MISSGLYDIAADRWVACIRTFAMIGLDLTGAVFAAQVRMVPDLSGAPLINLATVGSLAAEGLSLIYAGTATITAHITAGRLKRVPDAINPATGVAFVAGDNVALSQLGLRINETTMEGLPFPGSGGAGERGEPVVLAWDMHITPSGGIKDKYLGGAFTVLPGATQ